jgi:hypothetical protein
LSLTKKHILITGASGLIGKHLTALLIQNGYHVSHLGRIAKSGAITTYVWDITNQTIDTQALQGVDAIIHLAGAGIADKPWTKARKKELLESRTHSTRLLYQTLRNESHQVKQFISASAIGYYGFAPQPHILKEEDAAGTDFLAEVTQAWENEVDKFTTLLQQTAKLRIGIVLSTQGGALKPMLLPVKFGVGSALGSGRQIISWIHIDDICRQFLFLLENPDLQGAFNGVAPNPLSNKDFTKAIGKVLNKPVWLPAVPSFLLKIFLGEMANLVTQGNAVSCNKIQQAGFRFNYTEAQTAIQQLITTKT